MKVLMTGATGLIGKEIGKILVQHGHEVFVVSRNAKKMNALPYPCTVIEAHLEESSCSDPRLTEIEGVINLMGEPLIGARWTAEKKHKIYNSRVQGTRNLVESLPQNLKVFVSGSAVGFYGDCKDTLVDEENPPGNDFLSKVCMSWEGAASRAPGRVALVRTGIVLSAHGGALAQMLFPFRAGLGGTLGDGSHWMSWVHVQDIARLFVFALENEQCVGAINGTAPAPVTNKEFTETFIKVLGVRSGIGIPAFALKAIFGEASQVLLGSLKADATKSQKLGFKFNFNNLKSALEDTVGPLREGKEIFYSEQYFDRPPEKVFEFFKNAENLEKITPKNLQFKISKISEGEMAKGTEINYRLKLYGVPFGWKTEITEWQPSSHFEDLQKGGPFKHWQHQHRFLEFGKGTLMQDTVRYQLPGGSLGWLVGSHTVAKEVEKIFSFRRDMKEKI